MPKTPKRPLETDTRHMAAMSPEDAEKTGQALAYQLVLQRLRDGTATSQETTYFLKLSSQREKNENELARVKIEAERAKTELMNKQKHDKELYEKALDAFRGYSGQDDEEADEDEYED